MTKSHWQCPPQSTRPAAEWVAEQDKPPIEEHRKLSRPVFEWYDIEQVDFSVIDDEVEQGLKERGLKPRYRYKTRSALAVAGLLEDAETPWEFWCSDDGITTATLTLENTKVVGFETRFVGGTLLVTMDQAPQDPREDSEYHIHGGDLLAGYDEHRARVRERVENGEVALSLDSDEDREAFWMYYADYMAGKGVADGIEKLRAATDVKGVASWGCAGIGIGAAALLIGALGLIGVNLRPLWDWFVVWWPIVLIVSLPRAFMSWAVAVFKGHMNHLDHKYPDALDEHAGFWLKGRIRAEGMQGKVEVGKAKESFLSELDAYLPFRKKIVLGHKTYDKQDPTFWTIAAHELGHAIDYERRAFLAPLSTVSRVLFQRFMGWIYAALLLNTLFGWSAANEGIFWLIVATFVVGGVVLLDEAIASIIGMRILRGDNRMTDGMARDMRRHLFLAFGTYCSPFFAYAGMLVAWPWISEYILANASFTPDEPLIPGRAGVANLLSIVLAGVLAVGAGRSVVKMFRRDEPEPTDEAPEFCAKCGERYPAGTDECPRDGTRLVEVEPEESVDDDAPEFDTGKIAAGCLALVAYMVVSAAFALEVWDQPLGERFRAAIFLFSPMVIFLFAPVTIPVTLLLSVPGWLAKKAGLMPEAPDETPVARAAHAASDIVSEIEVLDPRQQVPWFVSAASPGPLLHALPLLVLWWLAQF